MQSFEFAFAVAEALATVMVISIGKALDTEIALASAFKSAFTSILASESTLDFTFASA